MVKKNNKQSLNINWGIHKYIFDRDGGICVYCGADATEIDHVIPVRYGGKSIKNNLVCVCKRCNRLKAYHLDNPEWLTKAIFWLMQKGEDTNWMDTVSMR